MSALSFASVFKTMNNAFNIEKDDVDYQAEKILNDQQNFNRSIFSTPQSYLSSEEERHDESIDFFPYEEEVESEQSNVSQLINSRTDSTYNNNEEKENQVPDNDPEEGRPLPIINVEKGKKSSKKRKRNRKVNHPMLSPCECVSKCIEKITDSDRQEIHAKYWEMDYDKQQTWLSGQTTSRKVDRERVRGEKRQKSRNRTSTYFLPCMGEDIQVCQRFFLRTLGYAGDSVLRCLFAKMTPTKITPPPSKRGKHEPKHKLSQETVDDIKKHIESYNPAVSHYRSAHAPLRRYLPPEISIREMYDDFNKNSSGLIHYSTYQKIVQSLNISFAKLGEEECEACEVYRLHVHDEDNHGPIQSVDEKKAKEKGLSKPVDSCTKCKSWAEHINRAGVARNMYREDAKKTEMPVYAVDLEKVIMLPRLPGNKTVQFTRRIILFNESFVPIGGHGNPLGYIWHEGIRGRNDEDIASCYIKFLSQFNETQNVLLWADNCTAQNKNWTLFSALVHYVNQPKSISQLSIRYFEKGHTFMAADVFHKNVEKAMRAEKKLYDFDDFTKCVSTHGIAKEMHARDFRLYRNELSKGKDTYYPHLSDVAEVFFKKGSTKIHWKSNFSDLEFKQGEFVQKKFRNQITQEKDIIAHDGPRGLNAQKQIDILKKLSPFMPAAKLKFWINIPVKEDSADLAKNIDG